MALELVCCLSLGVGMSILVSWSCAIGIDVFQGRGDRAIIMLPQESWEVKEWRTPGAQWVFSERAHLQPSREFTSMPAPSELIPDWSGLSKPSPGFQAGSIHLERRVADSRGWPARSMWSELITLVPSSDANRYPPLVASSVRGGLVTSLPAWAGPGNWQSPRVIPMRVIWRGTIFNALIYAMLVVVVWRVPRRLLRSTRGRRGNCVDCGYVLGSSSRCPECGAVSRSHRGDDVPESRSLRAEAHRDLGVGGEGVVSLRS